ncbi:hypothetical protein QYE76_063372 [Lolium multiflorum]|uniref:Uncharacterized protein n=1 Tax=Lolium multiflorum TaxID=4521 RepID=A0AAD8S7B0_LOLMU|nr:hypothetical protein QYE76_063372 [Lolium multiflorum]
MADAGLIDGVSALSVPYGLEDRIRNCTFKSSCFNTRKLSHVFVASPNRADAPPIWVERVGIKANITELDKGLGIGSKNPFFNHNQITVTMFMNLNKQKNGAVKPPPASLIAHGRYV